MSKQQTEVMIFTFVPKSIETISEFDCLLGRGLQLADHKSTTNPNGMELLQKAIDGMESDGVKVYRNHYQWGNDIQILLVTDKPLADTYPLTELWDYVFDAVVGLKMLETAIGEHVYGLEYHGKN